MFGRPINLTFDKKGEIYKTFIGGLISLGILSFIVAFSGMSTQKITNHTFTASSLQQAFNPGLLGNVNFNETGIKFILSLNSEMINEQFSLNDLFTYTNIYYEQQFYDNGML